MNHKKWKYFQNVSEKVTCRHKNGSQGAITFFDVKAGHCNGCRFANASDATWALNNMTVCECPVKIETGHTIYYVLEERVKFLKKVEK
jgi:hypothetical protein